VLEAALLGVPTVALYIVSHVQERIARRFVKRVGLKYLTLPNLILGEPVVPELWQEHATQITLVDALERVLAEPGGQQAAFARLRAALGPPDALERTAAFAVELAD
jgi:lipid-A-disaccharide synthase